MVNKDYILRLAERFGRELAMLLHLRQRNQHEEALITIDELFLRSVGLTTHFINSASEEMLLKMISPLGTLNLEKCLWIAVLLKEEGDIYAEMGKVNESYYRHVKSLFFFLQAALHEKESRDLGVPTAIDDLLRKLEEYELSSSLKHQLLRYFEMAGSYSKADTLLYELVEGDISPAQEVLNSGKEFYARLLKKSDADLQLGGLSRQQVEEGQEHLRHLDK